MQLQMKRMLVVMDGEGRTLKAVIVEGERLRLIDRRGEWREGMLKRVHGNDIILLEDNGNNRLLKFSNIDYVERIGKHERDQGQMEEETEVDGVGADDDLHSGKWAGEDGERCFRSDSETGAGCSAS